MFAAGQRIKHTFMIHGYTIAHAYCWELNGCAACHAYTCLHGLCDIVEMHMAGNDLIVCVYDADNRAIQLLVGKTERVKQRAVRYALHTFFHQIASHLCMYLRTYLLK